jgi:sortase A
VSVRVLLRGVGELLVTAGLVVLLFVVYQLYWTNIESDRAQHQITDTLEKRWADAGTGGSSGGTDPGGSTSSALQRLTPGEGFALMRIPRLGSSWVKPVVQGVTLPDLHKGLGHYPTSALPGQLGNFAVAGHRATNGEPFRNLDEVRVGDSVVLETQSSWFVYQVDKTFKVLPDGVWVIDPVPGKPIGTTPTQKLITLTTCDPRWGHTRRLIISGHLVQVQPKSAGRPAALEGVKV